MCSQSIPCVPYTTTRSQVHEKSFSPSKIGPNVENFGFLIKKIGFSRKTFVKKFFFNVSFAEKISDLSKEAYKLSIEKYSWDKITNDHINIFKGV